MLLTGAAFGQAPADQPIPVQVTTPPAIPSPVVNSHPTGLTAGNVTGSAFGTQGVLYIRAKLPLTSLTKAAGVTAGNATQVIGTLESSNRIAVPTSSWSDTSVTPNLSGKAAIVSQVLQSAKDRYGLSLAESDITFQYQVENPQGSSDWK